LCGDSLPGQFLFRDDDDDDDDDDDILRVSFCESVVDQVSANNASSFENAFAFVDRWMCHDG